MSEMKLWIGLAELFREQEKIGLVQMLIPTSDKVKQFCCIQSLYVWELLSLTDGLLFFLIIKRVFSGYGRTVFHSSNSFCIAFSGRECNTETITRMEILSY